MLNYFQYLFYKSSNLMVSYDKYGKRNVSCDVK